MNRAEREEWRKVISEIRAAQDRVTRLYNEFQEKVAAVDSASDDSCADGHQYVPFQGRQKCWRCHKEKSLMPGGPEDQEWYASHADAGTYPGERVDIARRIADACTRWIDRHGHTPEPEDIFIIALASLTAHSHDKAETDA